MKDSDEVAELVGLLVLHEEEEEEKRVVQNKTGWPLVDRARLVVV